MPKTVIAPLLCSEVHRVHQLVRLLAAVYEQEDQSHPLVCLTLTCAAGQRRRRCERLADNANAHMHTHTHTHTHAQIHLCLALLPKLPMFRQHQYCEKCFQQTTKTNSVCYRVDHKVVLAMSIMLRSFQVVNSCSRVHDR